MRRMIFIIVALFFVGCASFGGYYSYRVEESYPSPSTEGKSVIYYYPFYPYGLWWDFYLFYPSPDVVIIGPYYPSPRVRRVR